MHTLLSEGICRVLQGGKYESKEQLYGVYVCTWVKHSAVFGKYLTLVTLTINAITVDNFTQPGNCGTKRSKVHSGDRLGS